jgi:hypothetical protein
MLSFKFEDDFWLYSHTANIGIKKYLRQINADLDQKHCFCPCKLAHLRFVDCETKEMCEFAFCGLAHLGNLQI